MNANELRVGDFVNVDFQPKVPITVRVNCIDEMEGVLVDGLDLEFKFEDLSPIPLTRKLLLRLGLKEAIKSPANTHFTLRVSHKKAKGLSQSFRFENGVLSATVGVFWVEFEYVHQFQNWVYAMTGKELEIKNL